VYFTLTFILQDRAKSPRPSLPPGSKSKASSSRTPGSGKKNTGSNDDSGDYKKGENRIRSLSNGCSPRKSKDQSSKSSRASQSRDQEKKGSASKYGRSSFAKSQRPAKTHKPKEAKRPFTAQHLRDPARAKLSRGYSAGAVLRRDSSMHGSKGGLVKVKCSNATTGSRAMSTKSCLKFPDSIPTISGRIDIAQRGYIKKYLQSTMNRESRSEIDETRSATVQVVFLLISHFWFGEL